LAKRGPKGRKRRKRKGKGEPSAWARWKKWRTTTESHRLTARLIEAFCILLMVAFTIVAVVEHTYPPRTVETASWSSGDWTGEVDTDRAALTFDPRSSLSEYYYEVVDTQSGGVVAEGSIERSWGPEDEVRLPHDGTYTITISASGAGLPGGHSIEITEHLISPTTVTRLSMLNVFLLVFVAFFTLIYLFYWHRRFRRVYNRTFWIALSYYFFSIAMFRVLVAY
jgi:hypothetical protein